MKFFLRHDSLQRLLEAQRALGQIKEGLFQADLSNRLVFINEFGARLAGYETAAAMLAAGLSTFDFIVDVSDHQRIQETVDREGTTEGYVCRVRDIHGQHKWIEVSASLLVDQGGAPVGYWGVFRDLTERFEHEQARDRLSQELLQALKRLESSEALALRQKEAIEKSHRELNEFHSCVVHDLRAPLTSMKGFLDMLEETTSGLLDARGQHLFERLRFNSDQMDLIIRGLQELLLLEPGGEACTRVDPAQVLSTVVSNRRDQLASQGVQVESVQGVAPLVVHPTKFYQVLDNLVSNAIKAVSGRDDRRIRFGQGVEGNPRAYFVEDSGVGVPPELRTQVFQPFFRCDRSKPGAGVGLSIVRRIVDFYSGRVWIETGSLGGARVCFEIPQSD